MAITLEELAKEVQKLKDIEEIKVLKARYSDMCDSNHDWTQIKDLFAPDAKWIGDPTQPWGGGNNREEIEKLFQFYQTQMDGVPGVGVLGHNPMAPQITVAAYTQPANGICSALSVCSKAAPRPAARASSSRASTRTNTSRSTKTAISTPTASGSSASFHSGIRFALLLRTAGTIKSFSGNCRGLGLTAAQYIKQTQETE